MENRIWTLEFVRKTDVNDVKYLGKTKIKRNYLSTIHNDWKSHFKIPLIEHPIGIYCKSDDLQPYINAINKYDKENDDFPWNVQLYECETINAKIRNRLSPIKLVADAYKQYLIENEVDKKKKLKDWLDSNAVESLELGIDRLINLK